MRHLKLQMLFVVGVLAALGGCTDTLVESLAQEQTNTDDRLSLKGRLCTSTPSADGFPVKVVIVIDQSGSMCVSDPPGSQEGSGFCERAEIQAIVPPGVTEPGRVRALRRLVQQFRAQPNVQVSIVPFETNIRDAWPSNTGNRFARPTSASGVDTYIGALHEQLGKGTDYQGALAEAYKIISADITDVAKTRPAELPRTRYVVVFLTDGTPYPRCSANDTLGQYASPDQPDLTWEDSSSAREFCNLMDPSDPDAILGYIAGTDRNQNYQLFSYVRQLMELKQQHNVGDIRMHSVLLFNEEAVRACGPICQDLYGTYPGVSPARVPGGGEEDFLLAAQKLRGDGRRRVPGVQQHDGNLPARPGLAGLLVLRLAQRDEDADGGVALRRCRPRTSASRTATATACRTPWTTASPWAPTPSPWTATGTASRTASSRCARTRASSAGNDKDARGCDPASPLTLDCRCADTDGDGLSQFAEDYLRTRSGIVDRTGTACRTALEARYGLDPLTLTRPASTRTGTGFPTTRSCARRATPRGGTGPSTSATATSTRCTPRCRPTAASATTSPSPTCSSSLRRRARACQQGYNLFKVWFAEAPESGVSTDYGVWRTACAWAQYAPPGVRVPLGPELTLEDGNFVSPDRLNEDSEYRSRCVGVRP